MLVIDLRIYHFLFSYEGEEIEGVSDDCFVVVVCFSKFRALINNSYLCEKHNNIIVEVKTLASWLLRRLGWRCLPQPTERPSHSIICVAPHTSNQDFIIGKLYYLTVGKPHAFLMKKDWFVFPLNFIFRYMGGIPVDRSRKEDMVTKLSEYIKSRSEIHIAITPEGTRSYGEEWKMGFYRIAVAAGIPVELAVIDYSKKEVGIFEVFHPTGNIDEDIAYIRSRFNSNQAKYPNKFHNYHPL